MTTTHPSANDSGLNLDHLEALARAATPGPWAYQEDSDAYTHIVRPVASPGWIIASATQTSKPEREANGRWIAAANPAAVLELIALARRGALANQPAPTDWQAAHADMVKRNALLRERPDLPVDRIPAHAELVRLQEENARLRASQPAPTVSIEDRPEDDQQWAKVDPAVAFHLIERHAEDWADAGRLMLQWYNAISRAAQQEPVAAPQQIDAAEKAAAYDDLKRIAELHGFASAAAAIAAARRAAQLDGGQEGSESNG